MLRALLELVLGLPDKFAASMSATAAASVINKAPQGLESILLAFCCFDKHTLMILGCTDLLEQRNAACMALRNQQSKCSRLCSARAQTTAEKVLVWRCRGG